MHYSIVQSAVLRSHVVCLVSLLDRIGCTVSLKLRLTRWRHDNVHVLIIAIINCRLCTGWAKKQLHLVMITITRSGYIYSQRLFGRHTSVNTSVNTQQCAEPVTVTRYKKFATGRHVVSPPNTVYVTIHHLVKQNPKFKILPIFVILAGNDIIIANTESLYFRSDSCE